MNASTDAYNGEEFSALLKIIHKDRGLDLSEYRPTHLHRRIGSRIRSLGLQGYTDYANFLRNNPAEYSALFDSILINVTQFFRNPEAWKVIEEIIIPDIIARKDEKNLKTIRIWSAGSSTGEETYTAAILLTEALKRKKQSYRPLVYGTDMDDKALKIAELGQYDEKTLKDMPHHLRELYFRKVDDHYIISDQIRLITRFVKHNLVQARPLSSIDLLICRNISIYFNKDLQTKVYRRLISAINPNGFLMMGMTESLPQTVAGELSAVRTRERIYQRC